MENPKMKCSEEKLMNDLVELYSYYFKRSVENNRKDLRSDSQFYELGKDDGAVEALGAVMLQVFGGKAMYEIWNKAMVWANKE